jgi:hypothetical protein
MTFVCTTTASLSSCILSGEDHQTIIATHSSTSVVVPLNPLPTSALVHFIGVERPPLDTTVDHDHAVTTTTSTNINPHSIASGRPSTLISHHSTSTKVVSSASRWDDHDITPTPFHILPYDFNNMTLSPISDGVDRLVNVTIQPSTKHMRSLSSPTILDGFDFDSDLSPSSESSSSPSCDTHPQQMLRHKKRMTFHNRRLSLPNDATHHRVDPPLTRKDLNVASNVHSTPAVRLGHPTRPYYSAIRKSMSRPVSVNYSPPISPPSCTSLPSLKRSHHTSLPDNSEYLPGLASFLTSSYACSPMSGFSLSGETEMRMKLAGRRSQDTPCEYRFHSSSRRGVRDRIRCHLKRLSDGFRHLIFGNIKIQ